MWFGDNANGVETSQQRGGTCSNSTVKQVGVARCRKGKTGHDALLRMGEDNGNDVTANETVL